MSSLPPPPLSPRTKSTRMSSTSSSASSFQRSSSALPPPPNMTSTKQHSNGTNGNSHYAQSLARSMTIDEMRNLHRRALSEAEAKQTELRLVLASRYRELVGSSDEVTKMRERAQELDDLVNNLPTLMEKLLLKSQTEILETSEEVRTNVDTNGVAVEDAGAAAVLELRQNLSHLPRLVHRALDKSKVYEATDSLMELFRLIAEQTDEYPLATALSGSTCKASLAQDVLLTSQMRMTYMHVQTLPVKINRIAKGILHSAASFSEDGPLDPKYGAQRSAAALSALDMLTIQSETTQLQRNRPIELLDMYFDAKAKLLKSLLDQLNTSSNAEEILSKIVLILQYDIVLHPYQIFVLRKFPTDDRNKMMDSLPIFPAAIVQTKASNFLSAHLPLIRTKVKSVLIDIAGTTASALGKIRQSLYDKTDGVECMGRLDDSDGICTWDEAVSGVVDVPSVLVGIGGVGGASIETSSASKAAAANMNGQGRRFSLWSVLFSNTFSSLVHSILTTSFQSVHTELVSTLRLSLANAPSLQSVLPHEAYRNTLYIATQLDSALLKVSDDAHELLVHAEERVESERRLRQSLYVQTCEIMGRLICELRRMLLTSDNNSDKSDGVKNLIIGRLCHFLKFRLTALSTLLDPKSSPAILHHGSGTGGRSSMISIMELSSAFELADDNDNGFISFQDAMEAVDSAFSGTHFHGAEMVRETLLLPVSGREKDITAGSTAVDDSGEVVMPKDVTLDELTLLLARGLRHDESGANSALGAIQNSLDRMVSSSFQNWSQQILQVHSVSLSEQTKRFVGVACTVPEEEYVRLFASTDSGAAAKATGTVTNVSPHIISFLTNISFALNRSICPSDSLLPVPYKKYAVAMGVDGTEIPRMIDVIRSALLRQGLTTLLQAYGEHVKPALEGTIAPAMRESGPSGIAQLKNDLSFLQSCFFGRDQQGFSSDESMLLLKKELQTITKKVDILFRSVCNMSTVREIEAKQEHAGEACGLFISSLFGNDASTSNNVSIMGLGEMSTQTGGKTPLFHPPLASSCRFPLLPIQADRTLSGVQARGKYKEKEEMKNRTDTVGTGAVRAGFGFFSSMLKTS